MLVTDCPKCDSPWAWVEKQGHDTVLRCLCGYYRVLSTTLESAMIDHSETNGDARLPKQGSKLWNCLVVVIGLEQADTVEITDRYNMLHGTGFKTPDIATQLTVLRYRRLVAVLESRRGVPGGSIWIPTDKALELFHTEK